MYAIDISTHASAAVKSLAPANNGLGIADNGLEAFAFQNGGTTLARYNAASGSVTTYPNARPSNTTVIRGAVNPATGIYYYGASGTTAALYAWNTQTNTSIGQVGSIADLTSGNGDFAFSSRGLLFVVTGSQVRRVNQTVIPTVAGSTTLSTSLVANLPAGTDSPGIAFSSDGFLYVSSGTNIIKLDPASGAQVDSWAIGGGVQPTDLASCNYPNTISVEKNITGRVRSGDQFALAVTGGSITAGNTATTTGAATGVQSAVAGAALTIPGRVYTVTETAAGTTNLNHYSSSYECRNVNQDTVLSSGTGTTATFTFPAATSTDGTDVVCTFTNTPKPSGISVVKSVTPTTVTASGQQVTYSFLVTNTGQLPLTSVGINEVSFSGTGTHPVVTCPATSLAPGATTTCTATYVVTQADLNAGSVNNTATASGDLPGGTAITSTPSSAQVTSSASPALTLVKTVSPSSAADFTVGRQLTYSFQVTNTGNVSLSNVRVVDNPQSFTGSGQLSAISCPSTALEVGDSVTCSATYTLTQDDIDRGSVNNAAFAQGTPPGATTPIDSPPSTTQISGNRNPAWTLTKTVSQEDYQLGDVLTYTFKARNTGNVSLTNVQISDLDFSGSGALSSIVCPGSTPATPHVIVNLAPGAVVDCTATYEVTQDDVDAGSLSNAAAGASTPPPGTDVEDPTVPPVEIPAVRNPRLALTKSASPTQVTAANQIVTYSFLVQNTGNVTLRQLAVQDHAALFTGSGTLSAVSCPVSVLAPGAMTTCTATYSVTQADVDAGKVLNTATAIARPAGGSGSISSSPSTAKVTATAAPELALVKTASPSAVGDFTLNRQVTYSFGITNTGNVTLTDVSVVEDADAFTGSGTLSAISCPPAADSLAPGSTVTCTATYTLTQDDIDQGSVDNTATAEGTPPGADDPVVSEEADAHLSGERSPAWTLTKTVSPAQGYAVGGTLTYTFTARNTGNVRLRNVTITENAAAFTGSGTISAITCPGSTAGSTNVIASMPPGAAVACTATYTATQADVDAGTIHNEATGTATPPPGTTVDPPAPGESNTDTPRVPSWTLEKSADLTRYTAGDEITYTFTAANTGNVTLRNVAITDEEFTGTGQLSPLVCEQSAVGSPHVIPELLPNTSATCTATYIATQEDVDAGTISNTAAGTATPPPGVTVDDEEAPPVLLTADRNPALNVVKSANPTTVVLVGETVTYSYLITNTGNVTLQGLGVIENSGSFSGTGTLPAPVCPNGKLAPNESVTCTATYTLTQEDVDAGRVTNTATASGTPVGSQVPVVSDPSTAIVTVPGAPSLSLVKSSSLTSPAQFNVGREVEYTFLVTNTSNVTLTDVTVSEDAFTGSGSLSAISCPPAADRLAPRASVSCTATYTVTQEDVDQGAVHNQATAHGTPPRGADPISSPPSDVTITGDRLPALALTKVADKSRFSVGEKITYTFTAKNVGNVTLRDVTVTDVDFSGTGKLSAVTCGANASSVISVLPAGAAATCTATYVATQEDVDAGTLTNAATATGKTPSGSPQLPPVEPPTAVLTSDRVAGLAVKKSADRKTFRAGEEITYTLIATNTGQVTLRDVTVKDVDFTGSGEISAVRCPEKGRSTVGVLRPGESVSCTVTYVATQEDERSGELSNSVSAGAKTPPGVGPLPTVDGDTVKIPAGAEPDGQGPGGLPNTGGPMSMVVLTGLCLLGAGLLLIRRRRFEGR